MQETKLAQILTECLGTEFQVWNANDSSGCLGLEVFNSLKKTCTASELYPDLELGLKYIHSERR